MLGALIFYIAFLDDGTRWFQADLDSNLLFGKGLYLVHMFPIKTRAVKTYEYMDVTLDVRGFIVNYSLEVELVLIPGPFPRPSVTDLGFCMGGFGKPSSSYSCLAP